LLRDGTLDDVIVQLGANDIRWTAAAYPYDMLRTEIEITGNRVTKEGRVIVDYDWQVKNQNDVVVVEGKNTCMFKREVVLVFSSTNLARLIAGNYVCRWRIESLLCRPDAA